MLSAPVRDQGLARRRRASCQCRSIAAEQFTGMLRSSDEGEVWWAELAGLPSLDLCIFRLRSTFSARV
ncbi:MAG: hypothetical protein ACLRSD_03030 [Oscillibacter sp.]